MGVYIYTSGNLKKIAGNTSAIIDDVLIDTSLSDTSTNPVQNKVITTAIKQTLAEYEKKISGTNFEVDFETGNLIYDSPDYTFNINTDTGNLEWTVI